MAKNKFSTDFSPQPFLVIKGSRLDFSLSSRVKISAKERMRPYLKKFSICFLPSPEISKASFETKCLRVSTN